MLQINSLNEFREKISHKDEIREKEIAKNCISFCYMISAEDTFDSEWALECRGIVFSEKGHVISRPLHKFFNVGERVETRIENIDWSKVVRVMDKRDGSLIHTVISDQSARLKSKKSFDSEVAKAAEQWMQSQPDLNVWRFVQAVASNNSTAIFEWTAPDARIVLFYPKPELQLLHIRNNQNGEYLNGSTMKKWAAEFGVNCVDEVDEFFYIVDGQQKFDINKMVEAVTTREGIEGWVIQFEDGNMVKMKTEWYLKRHRAMTFLRERDIAQLVLDEGLDDMKSLLVGEGVDISDILNIESLVLQDMRALASSVEVAFEQDKHLDRKDFAVKNKNHIHFGLLMSKYTGKEPNFKEYFERHILKNKYGLTQIPFTNSDIGEE